MKTIVKDALFSVIVGLVLPGILLNGIVMTLERAEEAVPQAQAAAWTEETQVQVIGQPIGVRMKDGKAEVWELDEYLVGVVLAEMPASFELEALKAQSVAARTFAWKANVTGGKHGDGSVCVDSGCCQAHLSPEDYLEKTGNQEGLNKVIDAVYATSGQVLTYQGELIEATYFSCSGGSTEDAQAVWGGEVPYLQAVDSPGEESAAWFRDKVTFTFKRFQQILGRELEDHPSDWFGQVSYTAGGGVAAMEIGGETYTGTDLRSLLGLRSTAFSVTVGKDITITTRGYGHRVGMSQYGADAMAVAGHTYREILAHYYVGTEITEIGK